MHNGILDGNLHSSYQAGACLNLRQQGASGGHSMANWNVDRALLLPLLPIVYAEPEPDGAKSLRVRLARALLPVMASPLISDPTGSAPYAVVIIVRALGTDSAEYSLDMQPFLHAAAAKMGLHCRPSWALRCWSGC